MRRTRAKTRGGTDDDDNEERDNDEECDKDGEEHDDDNNIIIYLIIIYSIYVRCQQSTVGVVMIYVSREKESFVCARIAWVGAEKCPNNKLLAKYGN